MSNSPSQWAQLNARSLKFYKPLAIGRSAEFLVYSSIYRMFERFLNDGIRVSIFDQVADIDDVDFCLRIESQTRVMHIDCQIKSSKNGTWSFSENFLGLTDKRVRGGARTLLFLVDNTTGKIYPVLEDVILKSRTGKGLRFKRQNLPNDIKDTYEIIRSLIS